MSMNFNPMYGGNQMMGGMGMAQSMYGNPMSGASGSVVEGLKQKYGCVDCFYKGPRFVEYPMPINPLPREAVRPSLFARIKQHLIG